MSTYLVTGAAGFIASRVCEMLLEQGHTVVGLDNLNDYYDVRLKDYRLSRVLALAAAEKAETGDLRPESKPVPFALGTDPKVSGFRSQVSGLTRGNFTFYARDIENVASLDEVFRAHRFDAVINLAARAGVRASLEQPQLYINTNVHGERNVLDCQVKYGVKKHVIASSSSVYAGCPTPFVETAALGQPQSPYAETKQEAERLAQQYHREHGLDVTVLRYFTVFGPGGRPDMAPFRFIKWIAEGTPITLYGDGTQARDFTYIDDIARGTILAANYFGGGIDGLAKHSGLRSQVPGFSPRFEAINLGGGNNPVDLHTVISWIEEALGPQARARVETRPAHAADMPTTYADIAKAGRLLGWKPEIASREGFRRTVAWHRANAPWLSKIKV